MYTLNRDKLDALGNTTPFDTRELRDLRASLLAWLHDMADMFLKKAIDTLLLSWPFDYKLRFNRLEPLIKTAYLYKMSS